LEPPKVCDRSSLVVDEHLKVEIKVRREVIWELVVLDRDSQIVYTRIRLKVPAARVCIDSRHMVLSRVCAFVARIIDFKDLWDEGSVHAISQTNAFKSRCVLGSARGTEVC